MFTPAETSRSHGEYALGNHADGSRTLLAGIVKQFQFEIFNLKQIGMTQGNLLVSASGVSFAARDASPEARLGTFPDPYPKTPTEKS